MLQELLSLRVSPLGVLVALSAAANAQIPSGYYDSVDTSSAAAMRSSLHAVIDDHLRFPYTAAGTDTWNILELAQENPANSNEILDVYKNESYPKAGAGNGNYDREHPWPKSYGFPNDNASNYPYTDCHVLFLCDGSYNTSRNNKPFDTCGGGCDEKSTAANNSQGGGSGVYLGNSNWTNGVGEGKWETWIGRRGDVARALLYMDVRYEGGNHGGTGAAEPNLILTDSLALIVASNTGNNESVAYMGMLSVLLQWHAEDPVDSFESAGHEVVFSFQGNRNPFIDHPEWVDCLFLGNCAAPTPTAFCFGDGSGTPCPCGNSGASVSGCANSVSPTGATLGFSGTPSLAANNLMLSVNGSLPSTPGLFFLGTTAPNGGFGSSFGDGLLCASGLIDRLEVRVADSLGNSNSTISLSAGLGIGAGDTRYYQWWYRDLGLFACASAFNTSNAVEVLWGP